MAIDFSKAKPSPRHAGVYLMPDGRLVARAGVRMPNGKVKIVKKMLAVGATEADAVAAVEAMKADVLNPPPPPSTDTPLRPDTSPRQRFDLFCDGWLATREQRVSPSTAETYKAAIKTFIKPRLGWMECQDITRQAIESWVVWAEARKQKDGKQYTQDTMRQWWRCLSTIVGDMVADLNLPRDPMLRVRPPERPELAPVREQHTLLADAVGKLLEACKATAPKWYAEVATMALTGARAGEVYALKWDAVDFVTGQITIKRALSRGKLLERTKTKAQRVVPIHRDLVPILKGHRQHQIAKQVKGVETGMVFLSVRGKVRDPRSAKKIWAALCEKAGIDQVVGPQVLRRSMNTMMLAEGVDRITLRSIMGHTSEAMTQRYAGIGDAAKADAVNRVNPALTVVPDAPE